MAREESKPPLGGMNRREMLGATTALVGGAVVGLTGTTSAQGRMSARAAKAATGPNLAPPVVSIKSGQLRGLREGKTYSFLGIPYAEADRFEQPKPVQPWKGVRSAQVWGPVCPAPEQTNVSGDELVFPHRYWIENEHCQFLNVWTQDPNPSAKKPVMVWMHGGGFTNGSSMEGYAYDGRSLSEFGDVVVVSMNHRLNILGTLDLSAYGPEYANSRYTGTADLVASLQWVRDNIEAFGGGPGNGMSFGQAAGGGKVMRMMYMPSARGLFHKVSAQSGTVSYRGTDPAASIKAQQAIAAHTLKNLNLTGNDIAKLKTVSYHDLIAAGTAALQSAAQEVGGTRLGWNQIADDQYVMRELQPWAADIPFMAGSTFSEMQGTLQRGDGRKNEWTQKEIDDHLTEAFGDNADTVAAEFKKVFPSKKVQDVLYYAGGSRSGPKRALAEKLEKSRTPVYNYLFAWEYPINGGITAFHCSELAFCFHAGNVPQIHNATGGGPVAMALQDKVSQAWVNFAKTGNPAQPGLDWKPYTTDDPQAMVFDTVSESVALRDDKLVSFLPTGFRGRGPAPAAGRRGGGRG